MCSSCIQPAVSGGAVVALVGEMRRGKGRDRERRQEEARRNVLLWQVEQTGRTRMHRRVRVGRFVDGQARAQPGGLVGWLQRTVGNGRGVGLCE